MFIRVLVATAALVALSGCASIIRGTSDDFSIQTMPAGARAELSTGGTCYSTPCTLRMPRKQAFSVTLSLPGYQTSVHQIANPWSRAGTTTGIVGNVILGGAIGIGVDAATGANRDFVPNPLVVTMVPVAATPVAAAPAESEAVTAPPEAAPQQ